MAALFDGGGLEDEAAEPAGAGGIPPEVVPPFVRLGRSLLLESFQDLDDLLEQPLECGEPVATVVPASDMGRLAEGGAWAGFDWFGPAEGRGWLVLPEVTTRRLLARLLGSRDPEVLGELGRLHRTSLEAPFEELRTAMARHLEEEDLAGRVGLDPPHLEPLEVEVPEARVLRLDCPFEMNELPLPVSFYVDAGLALRLAEVGGAAGEEPPSGAAAPPAVGAARPAPDPAPGATPAASAASAGPVLTAYLGRASLDPGHLLAVGETVVLDRLAGDVVELHRDGRPIGSGRVVVEDDHYAIRVVALDDASDDPQDDEEEGV